MSELEQRVLEEVPFSARVYPEFTGAGVVGFVTLFGITVRNSIMLVSHFRYLGEQ